MSRPVRLAHLLLPLLLSILAAACTVGPPTPRTGPRRAPEPAGSLALSPYVAGLFTVEGEVAGRRLPFLFDTGGGVTLLTVESATAAGCVPFGHDVGFRHDGGQIAMQRCAGVPLTLGSTPAGRRGRATPALPRSGRRSSPGSPARALLARGRW